MYVAVHTHTNIFAKSFERRFLEAPSCPQPALPSPSYSTRGRPHSNPTGPQSLSYLIFSSKNPSKGVVCICCYFRFISLNVTHAPYRLTIVLFSMTTLFVFCSILFVWIQASCLLESPHLQAPDFLMIRSRGHFWPPHCRGCCGRLAASHREAHA